MRSSLGRALTICNAPARFGHAARTKDTKTREVAKMDDEKKKVDPGLPVATVGVVLAAAQEPAL